MVGKQIQCPACKQGLKLEGAPPADNSLAFGGGGGAPATDFGAITNESNARGRGRPSAFWELLTFRRMIAPAVLQVLFWLAVLGVLGGGVVTILGGVAMMGAKVETTGMGPGFDGPGHNAMSGLGTVGGIFVIITGLAEMVLGPFVIRMVFEMLILVFRMYDVMREVRDKLDRR